MVRGEFNRLALNARVEHTGPYDVTATIASSSQPDPNDLEQYGVGSHRAESRCRYRNLVRDPLRR